MKKNIFRILIIALIGYCTLQIPLSQLVGSKTVFTLFDSFAPSVGSFIGIIPGIIAVFSVHLANFLIHGAHSDDAGTIIRFFPVLFSVLYFAKKNPINVAVPLLAIGVFLANPVGRTVWYFSLFWLIPIITYRIQNRFLFARALGATFTAHAVGGALWIWTFHLPASVWNSLIPVVIRERLIFSLGITLSFLFLNNLVRFLEKKHIIRFGLATEESYLLPSLRVYD